MKILGRITLRRTYKIVETSEGFECIPLPKKAHETIYQGYVSKTAVEWLAQFFKGREISINQALRTIESHPGDFGFYLGGGYQIRYEVQRGLMVLVLQKRAEMRRSSGKFLFKVF